jgi:hypothetical protein
MKTRSCESCSFDPASPADIEKLPLRKLRLFLNLCDPSFEWDFHDRESRLFLLQR